MMASPYHSVCQENLPDFYFRQYYSPSNQRGYPKSKLNVMKNVEKTVGTTTRSRRVRCVAPKPIGTRVHKSHEVDVSQTKDLATVLGIGTANPANVVYQENLPDFYFRLTNSEHLTSCKENFKRICEKTMIKKRHVRWDLEAQLKENPAMCDYMSPSFNIRNSLVAVEVPNLGNQAALKAISDWGQPKSKITHLIFATSAGVTMPGPDFQVAKLLGLSSSIKRYMVYMQGCNAGGTALRLAKDLAESNENARVLVVCSEVVTMGIRGPNENDTNALVTQALFADGAAAVIVGDGKSIVDLDEKPLFQLVTTDQTILPNSMSSITATYCEAGVLVSLEKAVPHVISNNIENLLIKIFNPVGISKDWNNIFWMAHPGGRAILDMIEKKVGLNKDKLEASRYVLSEFGNMSSPSVIFVMEAMRNMSMEKAKTTTGDGFDWGVLLSMGPGITVETILVRSLPL